LVGGNFGGGNRGFSFGDGSVVPNLGEGSSFNNWDPRFPSSVLGDLPKLNDGDADVVPNAGGDGAGAFPPPPAIGGGAGGAPPPILYYPPPILPPNGSIGINGKIYVPPKSDGTGPNLIPNPPNLGKDNMGSIEELLYFSGWTIWSYESHGGEGGRGDTFIGPGVRFGGPGDDSKLPTSLDEWLNQTTPFGKMPPPDDRPPIGGIDF
jgi:hypothetical protein